jgi:hypothetical protein
MKKVFACSLLLISLQTQAQNLFGLGIKVGQNFSSVNNVYVDHNAASYHLGVTTHFGITKMISLVPEVILSQTKLEAGPNPGDLSANSITRPETYHLNYLSIPLLVQVSPIKQLSFQLGPQYGILLDQKKDGIENATLAFKNGEFSFVGGAKFDLGGFFVYGRYVIGLQDITDTKSLSASLQDQSTWKTRQWQLGVGLNLFGF